MSEKNYVKLHRDLAAYHAGQARQATVDVDRNYHQELSNRLATEARVLSERAKIAQGARRMAEKFAHRNQLIAGMA